LGSITSTRRLFAEASVMSGRQTRRLANSHNSQEGNGLCPHRGRVQNDIESNQSAADGQISPVAKYDLAEHVHEIVFQCTTLSLRGVPTAGSRRIIANTSANSTNAVRNTGTAMGQFIARRLPGAVSIAAFWGRAAPATGESSG
jgi:hypothetical protein